jgi:hypothetical protein
MPSDSEAAGWIRRNDAARDADRAADRERSMADLLEETARLSSVVSELRGNIEREPDVRPR